MACLKLIGQLLQPDILREFALSYPSATQVDMETIPLSKLVQSCITIYVTGISTFMLQHNYFSGKKLFLGQMTSRCPNARRKTKVHTASRKKTIFFILRTVLANISHFLLENGELSFGRRKTCPFCPILRTCFGKHQPFSYDQLDGVAMDSPLVQFLLTHL